MKKLFVLIIFLFMITGCSVKSNITINKDLTVKEEVHMTGTPEFFAIYKKSLPITTVNMMLETGNRKNTLIENGYNYHIDKSGVYPVVVASKNYNTIDSFTKNTIFKEQYFKNFETIYDGNLITIKADDYINFIDGDTELYEVKNFVLNIKLPYVVTSHNADSYDAKTNTYTWTIKLSDENKEINLTFDKTRVYVYNLVMYISICVLIIICIALIIYARKIIKKNKINNIIND